MALARVVSFEDVSPERMAEMAAASSPPEGMPPAEVTILHDPESRRALALIVFESEEDYARGDAVLDALPASDVPGRRTSVAKYEVAVRLRP
jgi:hypothetical protein